MSHDASRRVTAPRFFVVRVLSSEAEPGLRLSIRRSFRSPPALAWTGRVRVRDLSPTSSRRIVWDGRRSLLIAVNSSILLMLSPPAEVTDKKRPGHDVRVVKLCDSILCSCVRNVLTRKVSYCFVH